MKGLAVPPQIQSMCRKYAVMATPTASTTAVTNQKPVPSEDSGVTASLMPKMPATAPTPASTAVTAVSRFMISDRLLLTVDR